jgi:predicted transcriptional regulator
MDLKTEQLRQRRAELETANRDLSEQTSTLARWLVTNGGFSVREAAALLAISPARVDQMVQEPKKHRRRAA